MPVPYALLVIILWALPASDGRCSIDLNYWQTPTTCDECVDLCSQSQQGQFPYTCRSAVWDCHSKSCDLFAVQAVNPQRLVRYKGRTYFQPSGNQCFNGTGGGGGGATITDCPKGQRAVLSIFQNSTNPALQGKQVNAPTNRECGLLCVQNLNDKGKPEQCAAAQFVQGKCILSSKLPPGDSTRTIEPASDPNALYLEKKCYPENEAKGCSSIVLDPHHVLVGQNRKTVTAGSYDQCVEQCLATTEFKCYSGQYFAEVPSNNCILNEETRSTKPSVLQQLGFSGRRVVSAKRLRALRDTPVDNGEWTMWTECKNGEKEKHRYRNCKEARIDRCPKQTAPCTPDDRGDKDNFISNLLQEENCIPVQVEVRGGKKKRCDLGYLYHKNGTRTYCVPKKKPEDCIDLSELKDA